MLVYVVFSVGIHICICIANSTICNCIELARLPRNNITASEGRLVLVPPARPAGRNFIIFCI